MKKIAGICAAILLAMSSTIAIGQSAYPDRPVRILVGFSAGTAPDVTSRILAQKLSDAWGKPVIVENIVGAGGNLAVERTARAEPDGLTLALGGNGALVINPNLMGNVTYDPLKDFTYLTQAIVSPNILTVTLDVPAKNVQELVVLAKEKPDYFIAGHAGVGSSQHLATEMLMSSAGIKVQQIPYRGTTAVLTDLLAGRLNVTFGTTANLMPLVREGKLRALAITTLKRSPQFPEIPTMDESGFKGFNANAWFGLIGPAGLPKAITDKIYAETIKILNDPETRNKLENLGLQLVGNTSTEFLEVVKGEIPMWSKLIKDANISLR
jgi:tripartite-type tricarboxylate transporter receptor subunit TctC